MPRAETAARTVKFRTFRSYAAHQERMKKKALRTIEENGLAAALERGREVAGHIDAELREKKLERLYRVPVMATLGRFPKARESDSTWRTKEVRHVGSDTVTP